MNGRVFGADRKVTVFVNQDPSTGVLTGPTGEFSFSDVKVPYDLTVVWSVPDHPFFPKVRELHGLTRPNPVVSLRANNAYGGQKYIQGNLSGPTFPLDSSFVYMALRGAPPKHLDGPYNSALFRWFFTWLGDEPVDSALVGVEIGWRRTGGIAWGLAGKQEPFDIRTDDENVDLLLDQTIPTVETTLRYTLGAYTANLRGGIDSFRLMGAQFLGSPIAPQSDLGSTFEFPPEGGTIRLGAADAEGNYASIIAPAQLGGVTEIHFPETSLLRPLSPAKNATGLSRTPTFTWTAVPGATAYWLTVTKTGVEGPEFWFVLPPSTTSFQMPAYESLDVGLVGDLEYHWDVAAFVDPGMDADGVTDGTGLGSYRTRYEVGTMSFSTVTVRFFTTAP